MLSLKRNSNKLGVILSAVAMIALLIVGLVAPISAQSTSTDTTFTDIYNDVSPSVVSISVLATRDNGMGQEQQAGGSGTGFVLDNNGHIMTNNHVVEGATEIEVAFVDGTLARAEIIGLDPDSDLAVIQVDLPQEDLADLQPVIFGNSAALEVGETVLAIGSPFGQRWTLTSGIVSAVNRSIQGLTNFSIGGVIQTDAAINPGNSGGPLLNLNGEVVGVNSQIISGARSNAGIGFAVPGNLARRAAENLIESGYMDYSYIGITGGNVSLDLIEAFNLPNDTQGIVVGDVTPGDPAARAGLQGAVFGQNTSEIGQGVPQSVDIITAINGEDLSGISELITYLAAETRPGETVTVSVMRVGTQGTEELQFDVRLTPRP